MKKISILLIFLICQTAHAVSSENPDYVFRNLTKKSVFDRTKKMFDKLGFNYWLIEEGQIKVAASGYNSDYMVNIGHNGESKTIIRIDVSGSNNSTKFKEHVIFSLKLADLDSISEDDSDISVPSSSLLKLKKSLFHLSGSSEINSLADVGRFTIKTKSALVIFQIFNLSDKPGFLGLKIGVNAENGTDDALLDSIIEAAQLCDFDINQDLQWEG